MVEAAVVSRDGGAQEEGAGREEILIQARWIFPQADFFGFSAARPNRIGCGAASRVG